MASKNERLKAKRLKALRRGLEEALVENPPPSLNTVTHRLAYSTSTVLRENEPELMNRLAERYRESFRSRGSELERRVEPMLAEDPVPSVKEVCIRYHERILAQVRLWSRDEDRTKASGMEE